MKITISSLRRAANFSAKKTLLVFVSLFQLGSICVLGQNLHLDSLLTFSYDAYNAPTLSAKSYWAFSEADNATTSSYYIFDTNSTTFRHINNQFIRYYRGTRNMEVLRTFNPDRNSMDSTVFLYNEDLVQIGNRKYVKVGAAPYQLMQVRTYENLDVANRKTIETDSTFYQGELRNASKTKFEYEYDAKQQLITKTEYNVRGDELFPKYKLVQTYFEDGKIESATTFFYNTSTQSFEKLFHATFEHRNNERLQVKTNFRLRENDPNRIVTERRLFVDLTQNEDLLRHQFFYGSAESGRLYREDRYFYTHPK